MGDPAAGLAWRLPAGWQPVSPRATAVVEPASRLAAATFALRQTRPDRDCSPETARRQLPADGAIVFLMESRETSASPKALARLPARPARFRLPAPGSIPPPPPPPAGWPDRSTEAGDGIRVPPGWAAGALAVPRRVRRPRLLFWAANRPLAGLPRGSAGRLGSGRLPRTLPPDAVAVWVVEHPRGAPSHAFPAAGRDPWPLAPAAGPSGANYSVLGAALAFRGWRFSVRVLAGPRAAPADVRRAEISARSLGLSGAGRSCSAAGRRRHPERCVPRR